MSYTEQISDKDDVRTISQYFRDFLNEDKGFAAIAYDIFTTLPKDKQATPYIDANLNISDCNKIISLEFFISYLEGSTSDQERVVAKINKLHQVISDFRYKLLAAMEMANNSMEYNQQK